MKQKIFAWRKGKEAKNPWRVGKDIQCTYRGVNYIVKQGYK